MVETVNCTRGKSAKWSSEIYIDKSQKPLWIPACSQDIFAKFILMNVITNVQWMYYYSIDKPEI